METLIVLSALVCGVIAAPALQEHGFQEFRPTQDIVEELIPREKKSPAGNHGLTEFSESETSQGHAPDFEPFSESARSFHNKKPIIVKKKVGYHLYRDSDEEKEQATSRESCKERVKVKLCDEKVLPKSANSMKSTTIEDVGDNVMTEDEMKDSLKMAKEAIANLERDLKRIEQNPATKTNQRKHDAVDAQIHKDIDTARQVLDHIHRNFGNLESMSIHSTTSNDADSLHNVQLTIAKTEEERMAQWKEAMLNIKQNTELARNIEDSFRAVSQSMSTSDFHPSTTANWHENIDSHKILKEMRPKNSEMIENHSDEPKQCSSKFHGKKMTEKEAEEKGHMMDDMKGFASTLVESNVDENSDKLLRNDNHNRGFEETGIMKNKFESLNKKDNDPEQSRNSDKAPGDVNQFDINGLEQKHTNSMKSTENGQDNTFNPDKSEKFSTNENTFNIDPTSATSQMKSTEHNIAKSAADSMDKKVEKNINHAQTGTKNADDMITLPKSDSNIDASSDSNTHLNDKLQNNLHSEQRQPLDVTNTVAPNQQLHQSRFNENDAVPGETQHFQQAVLPLDNTKTKHLQGKMGLEDKPTTNTELDTHHDEEPFSMNLKSTQAEMKSVDVDNTPTQPSSRAFNMRWSSDQTTNMDHTGQGNGPNEFRADFHNRSPSLNTRFMNGGQMMPSMKASTHFDAPATHPHFHSSQGHRLHGHMTHGKTPGFDNTAQSTNSNPNMRDATVTFGQDNNMHWKPTHESARTAYGPISGAAAGPSPSAVGLFPNANVGGCSIPLLLSCSPQVTSGSLAKALPAGYSSSAYRTEDDFTFFPAKREIKKSDEIVSSTVNKMTTMMKQKTKTISDTKQ